MDPPYCQTQERVQYTFQPDQQETARIVLVLSPVHVEELTQSIPKEHAFYYDPEFC